MSELPKKRGRRPKIQEQEQTTTHKKRGRKPKKTVNISPTKLMNIVNTSKSADKNIILHLPIKCKITVTTPLLPSNDSDTVFITGEDVTETTVRDIRSEKSEKSIFVDDDTDHIFSHNCSSCENNSKEVSNLKQKLAVYEQDNFKLESKSYPLNVSMHRLDAYGKLSWTQKTNIYCKWCCHPFDKIPCIIPVKYFKETYYGYGCYCSFNCALADALVTINDSCIWTIKSLMMSIIHKITGIYPNNLYPAPPKEVLQIFGGTYTIEQFRNKYITFVKSIKVLLPPMMSLLPIIEEQLRDKTLINNTDNNGLRLKRNKPLIKDKLTK